MNVSSLLHLRSIRVLFVTLALALASTLAASADAPEVGPATASYEDLLASSGGGQLDESAITGVAPVEMPTAGVAQADTPVLVGSGPERESVAQATGADAVVSACTIHSARTDQTKIDQDCVEAVVEAQGWPEFDSIAIGQQAREVELAKAAAAEEAAGWPEFDSIAIGQQALASIEQAPQASSPHQMTF